MIELTINRNKSEFPEDATLLECITSAGIKVPTLCYHKALTPYGACRLYLVEVKQEGRESALQASCSYPATNGLVVQTDSERVKKARKIVADYCLPGALIQRISRDRFPDGGIVWQVYPMQGRHIEDA